MFPNAYLQSVFLTHSRASSKAIFFLFIASPRSISTHAASLQPHQIQLFKL